MQTVLVANVRSFPLAFAAFLSRTVSFHLPPLSLSGKRTPGKQDICDDETSKQDFSGRSLVFLRSGLGRVHFPFHFPYRAGKGSGPPLGIVGIG